MRGYPKYKIPTKLNVKSFFKQLQNANAPETDRLHKILTMPEETKSIFKVQFCVNLGIPLCKTRDGLDWTRLLFFVFILACNPTEM